MATISDGKGPVNDTSNKIPDLESINKMATDAKNNTVGKIDTLTKVFGYYTYDGRYNLYIDSNGHSSTTAYNNFTKNETVMGTIVLPKNEDYTIRCTTTPKDPENGKNIWHINANTWNGNVSAVYVIHGNYNYTTKFGSADPLVTLATTNGYEYEFYNIFKNKNNSRYYLAVQAYFNKTKEYFTLWVPVMGPVKSIIPNSLAASKAASSSPGSSSPEDPEPFSTLDPDQENNSGGGNSFTPDYSDSVEAEISEYFQNPNFREEQEFWNDLYRDYSNFSLRSLRSVIGLPFHFMDNVDPTVGASSYGKQFIEDILYEMPIAILRPGGPVMNAGISGGSEYTGLEAMIANVYGYYNQYIQDSSNLKEAILGKDKLFFGFGGNDDEENNKEENNETTTTENTADQTNIGILEDLFTKLFVGKYARFYTFSQDFRRYTQYVNTLCHLFIHFLGIGNKYYVRGDGQLVKYTHYNDTWEQGETDEGETLKSMFGSNRAIFAYYQPESAVSQSYSNSTQESSLSSTLTEASNMSKEFAFMVGTGVDSVLGQGVTDGLLNFGADLNTSNGLVGRLFGNVAEGAATIIAGNNMDIPEIYSSSSASTSTTLTFKLVSPYGDHESIFLYVLRPLARLMAMSLPRQFGPNSYTSPFLVQAFAKGQFNIQCGIVTNLSVKRCGDGGESFTVTNVPTELEVTMEIQDMYEMVTLTNEYIGSRTGLLDIFSANFNFFDAVNPFGTRTAARLLFNNIGLMDFCGAYCGFNLNAPETHTIMTMIIDMYINRISDVVEIPGIIEVEKWQSPQLTRWLSDAMYNTVSRSNRLSI